MKSICIICHIPFMEMSHLHIAQQNINLHRILKTNHTSAIKIMKNSTENEGYLA